MDSLSGIQVYSYEVRWGMGRGEGRGEEGEGRGGEGEEGCVNLCSM